ncbi:hypothetical protein [Xanthomonas phage RTH11]|nr:hypothetical protein [Xanthomonas phage RTH11]
MTYHSPQQIVLKDSNNRPVLSIEARINVVFGAAQISDVDRQHLWRFVDLAYPDAHFTFLPEPTLDGRVQISLHYELVKNSQWTRPDDRNTGGQGLRVQVSNYSGEFMDIKDAIADYRGQGHSGTFERFEKLLALLDLPKGHENFALEHFSSYLFGTN